MVHDSEVDAQLRRILDSSAFVTSARSSQFLKFCVDCALRGQASHLKETTIAVEVFQRAADYDPKSDPIVRVHARRVREKLEMYYRTAGTDDPIKIDLPKGGYVPHILRALPRRKTDFSEWEQPAPKDLPYPSVLPAPLRNTSAASPPGRRSHWLFTVMLMLAVALASFALAWLWRGMTTQHTALLGTLTPMESLPGIVSDATWSPDGSRMAFTVSQTGDTDSRIYIKDLRGGSAPVRLTEDNASESRPVWSPNGREIAFARRVDFSHFEILRFNLLSKATQSVGRFVTYWPIVEDHPALDWSPDGRFLLTAEQTAPANPMRILLISVATGERTALTSPPSGSSGDIDAKFSPDGKWVAFRRGGLGDLYVVSIQGEQSQPATRLTYDMRGVRGIAWTDHGASILFGTQRGKTAPWGLWKISKDGGAPQPVSPPDFDAINPALSSTGELVVEHRQLVTEIVEHSLAGDSAEHVLLSSNSIDSSPVYSPDGRSVVFASTRSGSIELWLYRAGDAAPRQLTHLQGSGLTLMPAWAPDGRSIVFSFRQDGATNLFVCDLASRTLRQITFTRNRDISPAYSSDGRYIFYSSNDDGASRIWRLRADGSSRAEPLFLEAVAGFLPSPDGKWLYFTHNEQDLSLSRRNLQDGSTEEIFHIAGHPAFFNNIVLAKHHIFLAVSQPEDGSKAEIFEVEPEARTSRLAARLQDLPPIFESGLSGFSVSPDASTVILGHIKLNQSAFYTAQLTR